MKKYFFLLIVFICLLATTAVASTTDGTIDPNHNYAWSSYLGWFNFATDQGNVHVTDTTVTGYIWNQNYGWINLSPTNGGVKNDGEGHLSGFAWGQDLGWGDYTGVTIDTIGVFHGSVRNLNLNAPSLTFDCDNCNVTTDWRPVSIRNGGSGSTQSTGSSSNVGTSNPTTPSVIPLQPQTPIATTPTPETPPLTLPITPGFPNTGIVTKETTPTIFTNSLVKQNKNLSPINLKIPKIHVNANIQSVGLEKNGDMTAPKGYRDVAWFKLGPHPGDIGTAVIAGHYGARSGTVFDNLHLLKKGDDIYVVDNDKTTHHFIVRDTKVFDRFADAKSIFSSNDTGSHLNLITCNGVWNKTTKTYSNRFVVFTDEVK